jgi:sugar phosphate isomerase/epimerase
LKLCCTSYSLRDYIKKDEMDFFSFIDFGKELKWDAVELHYRHFPSMEKDYLRKLKFHAQRAGVELGIVSGANNFTLPTKEEREESVNGLIKALEMAEYLGCPQIRAFGGSIPDGVPKEKAFEWAVECFEKVVPIAEEKGIVIGLENHGGITLTSDDVLAILDAVDSDWFGSNMDTNNFPKENRYEHMEKVADRAVQIHAKIIEPDEEKGDLSIDYDRVLSIARDAGYNGFVSMEYEGKEDAKTAMTKSSKYFNRVL